MYNYTYSLRLFRKRRDIMRRYEKRKDASVEHKRFHFDNVFSKTPQIFGAIHLKQIGDIYCESDHVIDSHVQVYHEICCIAAGTGAFSRNGERYFVKEGDIFLSPIGTEHEIVSDSNHPLRIFYCAFIFDQAHPEYQTYSEFERFLYNEPIPVISDSFKISNIFSSLFGEVRNEYKNKAVLMKLELSQLFLLTQRCFEEKKGDRFHFSKDKGTKNQLVYEIVQYIDNHLFHISKLTDIGDEFGYSYSYITQSFSSVMRESLNNYYRRKRLKKAAELLTLGFTVTAVSGMLKFDSIQSFSRSFKSFYGVSPSAYVKNNT